MQTPYTLRFATPEDAPIITLQRRAMFADMQSSWYLDLPGMDAAFTAWVAPRIANGEYVGWLALDGGGEVVAGAGVRILDWTPQSPDLSTRRAYIMNVFVDEAHRRGGIARLMLNAILAWCRDQRIHHITLHASDKGRALYESLGFEATNEMRLYLL
jgi:GNAT superfamily N-acetyltransferase